MNYDVSIVIACYNEEGILLESVKEIQEVMQQARYSCEFIFIDDASKDKTKEVITQIVKGNPNMVYRFHQRNVGRGGTVAEGIRMANGRIVGFLDIDLEVDAKYIPIIIQALDDSSDIATGYRFHKLIIDPVSLFRHLVSIAGRKLISFLLNLPLHDTETGYKFFKRDKILPIIAKTKSKGWFWDTEVMALSYYYGLKIKEVPCVSIRRCDKVSSVKIFKDSFEHLLQLYKFRKRVWSGNNKGIIYRHPLVYQFFMRLIYGKYFKARYEAISQHVPEAVQLVELCCGDCRLYQNYLRSKNIDYLGLDISPGFITNGLNKGINVKLFDLSNDPLPQAEYILIQASLYQFIPLEKEVLNKIFSAALKGVIFAEPVLNVSSCSKPFISGIVKRISRFLTGSTTKRFDEKSLDDLFTIYADKLKTKFKISGGREIIGIFKTN
ncbi:MAG: glycosyltransferase family 2 protein [Candidatus Omnitrophica bacterium]|nr:glycosyltransferase family 2 protein [Candidatus Omnitrophota bacterium]MBU2251154.1 glycosyltransferase family 2 protein [Candidatus Omnitrophota bacterium]MBU2266011.1 glycosyltransferase family 2 protein [Candidatus Omnitrophota bacterium]